MDIKKILSKVDHTLLRQDATEEEIFSLCDDAIKYGTASVCIPGAFVKAVKEYVSDKMAVCTVIGFPNGYSSKEVKCFEAKQYIDDGADEIDTVINICDLKDKKYDKILCELKALKQVCGDKILKVIIECCLLTDEEKIIMCDIVSNDYNASSIDEIDLTVRARKLVDKANDLGGSDNITVVLMRV